MNSSESSFSPLDDLEPEPVYQWLGILIIGSSCAFTVWLLITIFWWLFG